jgi:hypothetical protein
LPYKFTRANNVPGCRTSIIERLSIPMDAAAGAGGGKSQCQDLAPSSSTEPGRPAARTETAFVREQGYPRTVPQQEPQFF